MERDEVLRLADSAGVAVIDNDDCEYGVEFHSGICGMERFAALVAAAEREACMSVAGEAKEGAVMSKYATIGSCQSARDMADNIERRIRSRVES